MFMLVTSTEEFRNTLLDLLSFSPFPRENYILYKNEKKPENGYFLHYSRPGCYDFGIADYTIPKNFALSFHNPSTVMRFGTVYAGTTSYRLDGKDISSFSPSSFFVVEKGIKGQQAWKQGQHFHGVEITIYEDYISKILKPYFPQCIDFDQFIYNYTYPYLPLDVVSIIEQLSHLAAEDSLTPLYLEGKIIECMALFTKEVTSSPENTFTNQVYYGNVKIGSNRQLHLTASDIHAIQKAHLILTEQIVDPPTIESLSKQVLLNQQKLKAGFSFYYHMTIGAYTNTVRMMTAANLLATTELSVEEISHRTGYHYCSNFSKMFKKTFGKTPLEFRKSRM